MYSPDYYREDDERLVQRLIDENGFAYVTTDILHGGSSHLPLILERGADGERELWGHMARANSHWQELAKERWAKAVFQGPHGYISPDWYQPAKDNVPTWNYSVVHAKGLFEIIDEPARAARMMRQMVGRFEAWNGTSWKMPEESAALDKLMKGIVVFRLHGLDFESKFKLSQKQSSENREGVIRALKDRDSTESKRLAEDMELTAPAKK